MTRDSQIEPTPEVDNDTVPGVTSPRGFLAGATYCGLRRFRAGRRDLGMLYSEVPCSAAGVFTRNKIKAAPVVLSQQHLAATQNQAQAIVFNSGYANACLGQRGYNDAVRLAEMAAGKIGLPVTSVLVASTGLIGVPLPLDKIEVGLTHITLTPDGGHEAANAILTRDTRTKEIAVELELDGKQVTIGGMAKGSGMIHPNMATMLGFITTDAAVDTAFLQNAMRRVTASTFNMVTVDGDTSTNDCAIILANGLGGNRIIKEETPEALAFESRLTEVAAFLAKEIARDGEGATKLIEVRVSGATGDNDARIAAKAIAGSNLVKAAVHGGDPNWGRILVALGQCSIDLDPDLITLAINNIRLITRGDLCQAPEETRTVLNGTEVVIEVDLGIGEGAATAWGCDLAEEYVIANSRYYGSQMGNAAG
ncbi:MAG: bifunctional glutamate N-acetyltransferase/amino-acid acetyltransferase ArgJ [Candidatus Marsarchaeota archaeon]|nr:bifunctional glutamate N-acetyltransferase/amino-acid acetyltransferase ArgJ [Candidatus Marsarchaeota archaeon]